SAFEKGGERHCVRCVGSVFHTQAIVDGLTTTIVINEQTKYPNVLDICFERHQATIALHCSPIRRFLRCSMCWVGSTIAHMLSTKGCTIKEIHDVRPRHYLFCRHFFIR